MVKEKLADTLSLPKDILLGAAIVTITGTYEVYVQNFMGIIEYNDKLVKMQTKSGRLVICGKKLLIEYFTNDDVLVKGSISEVRFDNSQIVC